MRLITELPVDEGRDFGRRRDLKLNNSVNGLSDQHQRSVALSNGIFRTHRPATVAVAAVFTSDTTLAASAGWGPGEEKREGKTLSSTGSLSVT